MRTKLKRAGFRLLLIVLWPAMPLALPAAVLWEDRHEIARGLRTFYSLWAEAFRKGRPLDQ